MLAHFTSCKAERTLGELLEQMPKQRPGQHWQKSNGTAEEPLLVPPTLAEIGISKKQSSRAQKFAVFVTTTVTHTQR